MDLSRTVSPPRDGRFRVLQLFLSMPVAALMLAGTATSIPSKGAQQSEEIRPLIAGVPIERELAKGKSHSYRINLDAGQYLHAEVEQRGVNVALVLLAPDNETITETNLALAVGWESLSYVPAASGQYLLVVKAASPTPPSGTYQIKVEIKSEATAQDKSRMTAESLLNEAASLAERKGSGLQLAIEKYQQAKALWHGLGDRYWEAQTLNELARCHSSVRRDEAAIEGFEQALAISRDLKDRASQGRALNGLGNAHRMLGHSEKAFELIEQALAISREIKDRIGEGNSLNNLGAAYREAGQFQKAIELYEQALAMRREVNDRAGEAITLSNLGAAYGPWGKPEKAVEYLEQALVIQHEMNDRAAEGATLNNLGAVSYSLNRPEKAIGYFEQAMSIGRKMQDPALEGFALNNLGFINSLLGRDEKAIEYYEQALALGRESRNRSAESRALSNLGNIHQAMNRHEQAARFYEEALVISRERKDQNSEGNALNSLGMCRVSMGQFEKAIEFYEQALAIKRKLEDRASEGGILINLGGAYYLLSREEKAIEYYNLALALGREIKNKELEKKALENLGISYRSLGRYEEAIEYFNQSLPMSREMKDRSGEGGTLNDLGITHNSLKRYERAAEYFNRALAIGGEAKDRIIEEDALNGLGKTSSALNRPDEALAYHERALALSRELKDRLGESNSLNDLGEIHRSSNRYEKAVEYFEQALTVRREIKNRSGEAKTLYGLALTERDHGNLARAQSLVEESLRLTESLRSDFDNRDLRTSYFASVQEQYQFHLELLMQLHRTHPAEGFDALALQSSERARARILLEMLGEARVDIRREVETSLVERERNVAQQINARANYQMQLLSRRHRPEEAELAKKELGALEAELQQIQAEIRRSSPRYTALTQPIDAAEIQRLLDPETILLEYALGNEHSYLWAVTPEFVTSYQLPPRAEIEAAAMKVRDLLISRRDETDADYRRETDGLSRMLLGPLGGQLGSKRLVIVASGALQYLPFAVLPVNGAADRHPLIVEHEIVDLPSASTLAVLRRETAGRQPAAKAAAVLADPVFGRDDPRVGTGDKTRTAARSRAQTGRSVVSDTAPSPALPSELERAVRDAPAGNNRPPLSRLPFSRREAEAIMAAAPKDSVLTALDFQASRAIATSGELAQYRIVHFATHGLLDSEHPELSGLVFSLVDQGGRPQDGYLRLHEIYNLHLSADLVVLSACRTGLGKEIKGEGLIGLTRGFMYAGAPRVVASLWQVDDVGTAELMKRFYRGVFHDGLPPAAALRMAQIETWKKKLWQAPFYWGAFVLQGEWR